MKSGLIRQVTETRTLKKQFNYQNIKYYVLTAAKGTEVDAHGELAVLVVSLR